MSFQDIFCSGLALNLSPFKRLFKKKHLFRSSKSWVASPPVFVLFVPGETWTSPKDRLEPTERYRGFRPTHDPAKLGGAKMNWSKQFVWCPRFFYWLHPWNLTWNLERSPWKRRFLLDTIIFRFHVKFRGSKVYHTVDASEIPIPTTG